MNKQAGFTLVELVAVIVIVGILAATALPRFINMSAGAKTAAVQGVAGNMGSAMAMNYAAAVATSAGVSGTPHVSVDNCDDVGSLLLGGLPAGYEVVAAPLAAPLGTTASCTVRRVAPDTAVTATFQGIAAP